MLCLYIVELTIVPQTVPQFRVNLIDRMMCWRSPYLLTQWHRKRAYNIVSIWYRSDVTKSCNVHVLHKEYRMPSALGKDSPFVFMVACTIDILWLALNLKASPEMCGNHARDKWSNNSGIVYYQRGFTWQEPCMSVINFKRHPGELLNSQVHDVSMDQGSTRVILAIILHLFFVHLMSYRLQNRLNSAINALVPLGLQYLSDRIRRKQQGLCNAIVLEWGNFCNNFYLHITAK